MVKNLPAIPETWVQSVGQKDLLEKEWLPIPVFLPEESRGQSSLVGYSPWGCKASDMTEGLIHTQAPSPHKWLDGLESRLWTFRRYVHKLYF